ncbi:hypothetical protein PG985_013068 [Apiospora marii]|uniref:uncharacterized protein n=1 Tax=Apiospora marii TaxID=335849 RepID=UPI00312E4A9D
MQRLPLEVVNRIVSFLPGGRDSQNLPALRRPPAITPYATISAHFLDAVERRTWRRLHITNDDLEHCAQYLRGCRLAHLQELYFAVFLPPIDKLPPERHERPTERKAMSQAFGLQVRRFFGLLHSEPWREGAKNVQLYFHDVVHRTRRQMRTYPLPGESLFEFLSQAAEAEDPVEPGGLNWYRQIYLRLALPGADELPMLHSVRYLSFGLWERRPDPGVQVAIAARMPDLVALILALDGTDLIFPGVLRNDRQNLARALARYSDQTLRIEHAGLQFGIEDEDLDQFTVAMPNYVYPLTHDVLSATLRAWSQRLTSFTARGVFDESLFWPSADEEDPNLPEWPNLQCLDVQFEICTPAGGWYFLRKGETSSSFGEPPRDPATDPWDMPPAFKDNGDYDQAASYGRPDPFDLRAYGNTSSEVPYWNRKPVDGPQGVFGPANPRHVPNEATMEPLLAAWARALTRMPSLRSARLSFKVRLPFDEEIGIERSCPLHWDVVYEAPGHHHPTGEARYFSGQMTPAERAARRLTFVYARGWRPGTDTMDLLRAAGAEAWPGTPMAVLAVSEWFEMSR